MASIFNVMFHLDITTSPFEFNFISPITPGIHMALIHVQFYLEIFEKDEFLLYEKNHLFLKLFNFNFLKFS